MTEEEKRLKKAVKKAKRQADAKWKVRMEVSRTVCSLGALALSMLSVAHVYGFM